jgi:adenosylmethionine-8-amino-7-oxononanoate aminotransferase
VRREGHLGGYLPLAATLATEEVFSAFLGPYEQFRAFFPRHTYTGNPLACAVGLASLRLFREERTLERLAPKIARLRERLASEIAPLPHVGDVRQEGVMVGIELVVDRRRARRTRRRPASASSRARRARARGVIIRPLGNVIVLMPPLAISPTELDQLVDVTRDAIRDRDRREPPLRHRHDTGVGKTFVACALAHPPPRSGANGSP